MTHAELKKEWDVRVAAFNASGQSIPKWCADQNLKTHQLRYWMRKLDSTEASLPIATEWFSIDIDKKSEETSSPLVVKVGQVGIEVKPGFDPELLAHLVKTLITLC